jgi:hypothetical protein
VFDGDFPMPGEVGEQFLRVARYPKNIGSLDNPSGQVNTLGESIADYYRRASLQSSGGSGYDQ